MLAFLEYLGLKGIIATGIILLFVVSQVVGEVIELKGKVAPGFLKLRKMFQRKRQEREAMRKMIALLPTLEAVPETMADVKKVLTSIDNHYSHDNITMRDGWMKDVNERLKTAEEAREENRKNIEKLEVKLDKNNADTLSLLILVKRNTIISFADLVVDETKPVTREQFNRIFKLYKEYEDIIKANNMTNGEVDIAIRVICESYEHHMHNRTFLEDIRGYIV